MDDTERPVVTGPGPSVTAEPASQPEEVSETPQADAAPQALSKNAIKKAAKAEKYAAYKLERRAREKETKKEKKRVVAEKRAAGELDEDEEEKKRQKKRPKIHFGGKVIVDLGFDEMMNEKEITSLCSQLAYTYSANRNASYPFSLVYSSLNGRTFTRLEGMSDAGYKRWAKTEWWHEGYDRLWQGQGKPPPVFAEAAEGDSGEEIPPGNQTPMPGASDQTLQQNVIYLTADSEDELTELKPEEVYIIGGICDHNRYKNLCLSKAKESGVRTARLPIGRYLASLPTRKVLTVNQVFEILLRWVETKDWEEALYSVIPKRKFQTGEKGNTGGSTAEDRDDEAKLSQDVAEAAIEAGPLAPTEPRQEENA